MKPTAATKAAAMEPAAAEAATVTTPASTAMTTSAAASTTTRHGGTGLGECQNACERGNSNTQTTADADCLHADLLLTHDAAIFAAGER
jgi:hypothetical protein